MSKVKIEAITNVHIGSGEMLNLNNDFTLAVDSDGYNVVSIVDPRKVLNLIGMEHINTWIEGIERKRPIGEIVKQYAPKANVEDYSLRLMELFTGKVTETLKECIHDGLGRPYIPGSSIKGAIRTAVLATLAAVIDSDKLELINNRGMVDASVMEKKLFGKDPNSDVFRFLHVGDAIFGEILTSAITMVNINERQRNSFWDESKSQTIETISIDDEATFEIRIKLDEYNNSMSEVGKLPQCMTSLPLLFDTINGHTLSLLESEIGYWTELKDEDNTHKVDAYLTECQRIKTMAEKCQQGKSCLLRVGHGCGWRFITGAWSECSPLFDSKVVPVSRPGNNNYTDYDFPKSRRVCKGSKSANIKDGALLGFVKLSII